MKYRRRSKKTGMFPLEAEVYESLPKKRTKYEAEKLDYYIRRDYIPDFIIKTKNGKVYLEVKGYLRYEDQVKMRAVKEAHPDLDIRFYFPKPGKVAGSKMTNEQWCAKYGFPCAVGTLPEEWFE